MAARGDDSRPIAVSWHRGGVFGRHTGATVLRLARWSLFIGTAVVVLGLGKVHAKYLGFYDFTGSYRFGWALAYVLLLCVGAYGVGLPDLPRNAYQALWSSLAAALIGGAGISVAQLVLGSQLLPRFVIFWSAVFLVPGWSLTGFIAARGRRRQRRRDRVLLVGSEEDAGRLSAELGRNPERRATIVDVLKPDEAAQGRVVAAATTAGASVVVLAREALNDDAVIEQVASLHEHGLRVRTLTLFYDEWLGKLPLSELERVALMFDIGEVHRARYGRFKRTLDLLVGLTSLPLLAVSLPVVIVGDLVANRGPLFYRQLRVGRNDEVFSIWKYRTMRRDAVGPTHWTTENDPRITPFGRMLRRTHVDELPQAINLLKGDLTTVGPRPEQPAYVDELSDKIRFYRLRHLVRPGVTGWAQVKYDYGASEFDAMEKLQYEFWYLRHQGPTLDLRIIGRTLRTVLSLGGH
jgi:lipopolysaccharide/colanic/teichoic acid biosynthesis glycosyltransferase